MGLLDGLGQFGLSGLEDMNIYENPKAEKAAAQEAHVHVPQEQDFLFEKTYTCPICDKEFKAKRKGVHMLENGVVVAWNGRASGSDR